MKRILGGRGQRGKGNSPNAPATWPRTPVTMATRGLIFADANVLYDDSLWLRWLHAQLRRAGPVGSFEDLQDRWDEVSEDLNVGRISLASTLQRLFEQHKVPATLQNELAVAAATRRSRLCLEARPFAGVVKLIRNLSRQGYLLGLMANSESDRQQFLDRLVPHGLNMFDVVLTSRDLGVCKPHAAAYLNTAAQLRLPLEEIVYVAAHERDLAGAKSAGLRTIACSADKSGGGACCIATLNELTAHISPHRPLRKTG